MTVKRFSFLVFIASAIALTIGVVMPVSAELYIISRDSHREVEKVLALKEQHLVFWENWHNARYAVAESRQSGSGFDLPGDHEDLRITIDRFHRIGDEIKGGP